MSSHPVSWLLQIYVYVLFGRVILSWFPISPDSPFAAIYRFLYAITESEWSNSDERATNS